MCSIEGIGNLQADVENLAAGQRLPRNDVLDRLTIEELHHNEMVAIDFVDFVDGTDVGMVERRRRPRLALKPLERLVIVHHVGRQKFQCYVPTQLEVLSPIDHTHAAATQTLLDTVVGYDITDHRRFTRIGDLCRDALGTIGTKFVSDFRFGVRSQIILEYLPSAAVILYLLARQTDG